MVDAGSKRDGLPSSARTTLRTNTIRGVACLLLVTYHVVGADRYSGMRVSDSSAYRTVLADGPLLVRMPLFTFLSGYVYAYRPVREGVVGGFLARKVRRLLVPLVVASTAAALLQSVIPDTNDHIDLNELWRIYIWPFGQYWYLFALFAIFLVMTVLDRFRLVDTPAHLAIAFAGSVGLFLVVPRLPGAFGLEYAAYLLPFFLWGVGVHSFGGAIEDGIGRRVAIALGAVAIALNIAVIWLDLGVSHGRLSVFGLLLGLCITLGLQALGATSRWLAWLGGYSYAIYLYHVFATAGTRIVVRRIVDVDQVILTLGIVGGVLFPIGLALVAERHPWSRVLLLGQSPRPGAAHGEAPLPPVAHPDRALES